VRQGSRRYSVEIAFVLLALTGCADLSGLRLAHPSVAPANQPSPSLDVDASQISPMYRELLAVDLATVARVAMTRNLDVQQAEQRIEASRGEYESRVGAIVPAVVPNVTALGSKGALASPGGGVGLATFTGVIPAVVIQWIVNPGQVVYDLIASKRRLEASVQEEQAAEMDTLRLAASQYYDLVLAQAQVAVARQAVEEAEELLRLNRLRLKTGTGLPADVLRAEAALAAAQQNMLTALNGFYNSSVTLTVTLHLDPTVMLVPRAGTMAQTKLVRDDLSIDDLLMTAVRYRPDLLAVRTLWAAAEADEKSVAWGGLGPQIQAQRTLGPPPPAHRLVDTLFRQQRYALGAGFNWSAATFGTIKAAAARVEIAGVALDRQLDRVSAAVVSADQASRTAAKLIPLSVQQVASAEEALRLTQQNLQTGTALTIDVLQAQDAADQARLRYASAMVRYNQSQVDLLAAIGLIEESNVVGGPTPAPVSDTSTAPQQ
jgi:outer membrane protein TolC